MSPAKNMNKAFLPPQADSCTVGILLGTADVSR